MVSKNNKRLLMLGGFLGLVIILIIFVNQNENFSLLNSEESQVKQSESIEDENDEKLDKDEIHASAGGELEEGFEPNEEKIQTNIPSCLPKDQLMPQELLPQDSPANQWSLANPQGSGTLKDKNFLQAGYHVGINTVGQTLRNANLQLRSDPPNPQVQVSPWLQTTINPDTNRKPFEIGGCS